MSGFRQTGVGSAISNKKITFNPNGSGGYTAHYDTTHGGWESSVTGSFGTFSDDSYKTHTLTNIT